MEVEMKMVKSLLLGTAAGFVAVAGAQAADMPVKAAVQYVKICNLYGDGFYYIPGTNICLKLGGYVRAQFYGFYGQNATATPFFDGNINNDRGPFNLNGTGTGQSDFTMRTRSVITVDTREQTDYGVLRTYFLIGHTGDSPNAEALYANRGFIQFAGFTFGLAQSFFDFYSAPATSYFATNTEDTGDGGWRVAAYTANFGNGITSTVSLEEPRRTGIVNASFAGQAVATFTPNLVQERQQFTNPFIVGAVASNDQGEIKAPDLVYNTRIDQQWGSLMVGGALTDVTAAYYGATVTSAATGLTQCAPPGFNAVSPLVGTNGGVAGGGTPVGAVQCGHPADKLGWVVTGGVRLNVPGGSYLQAQGSYTQGGLRYISHTQFPFGSAARFGVGNSLGVGPIMDAIFGQSGELELTRAWGAYASWEQVWNPHWKTSIYGGYVAVMYDDNAKALIAASTCGVQNGSSNVFPGAVVSAATAPIVAQASGSLASMTNCDPNWQIGYVGSRTQWNVTSQFYMGVDILYTKLYTAFNGLAILRSANERPSGVYSIENQDNWAVTFRVHRDFVL
jgi:hypothetical protein